jgi:hypothetical protein
MTTATTRVSCLLVVSCVAELCGATVHTTQHNTAVLLYRRNSNPGSENEIEIDSIFSFQNHMLLSSKPGKGLKSCFVTLALGALLCQRYENDHVLTSMRIEGHVIIPTLKVTFHDEM